ncbi:MAG: methyl-accepting chemotaxis protein, partial [Pyrinomonadaceae bacterium]
PLMIKADDSVARLRQIIATQNKAQLTDFSVNALYPAIDPVSGVFSQLVEVQLQVSKVEYDAGVSRYGTSRMVIALFIILGILLAGTVALYIVRGITRPLLKAVTVARQLSGGVLSDRLAVESTDETGQLLTSINEMTDYLKVMAGVADDIAVGNLNTEVEPKSSEDVFGNAFKKMVGNLRASIGQIGRGSNQVASASSQIAAASDQSKRSSQTLAASAEEITATIHEMAASIRQVSGNAQTQSAAAAETSAAITQMVAGLRGIAESTEQLAGLTDTAHDAAQTSQRTLAIAGANMQRIFASVESAGQTINSLGERAENIGKIVETIDDIADQTNLLALNAAIEAARAGEHGLGFAVVADEVRKLAERSARSTREISELIEAIQRESRAAVGQMEESNTTVKDYIADTSVTDSLHRIIAAVERIVERTREIEAATSEQSAGAEQIAKATQDLTRLTQEIGAATEEQSVGAAEVVKAMEQLRSIVHQSVEMASELQGSAEQLYRQSDVLNGVVGQFRIEDESSPRASADRPLAPFKPASSGRRVNDHQHLMN